MKTNMIYLFILSLILSSCQEDKIDFAENPQEVTFLIGRSGDVATRAEGTSFDVGDKIGIYIVRHQPYNSQTLQPTGNYADNKCFRIVDGANILPNTESDKIYSNKDGYVYSIYAYYPYDAKITDPTNIDFEVETDQCELQEVKKSDFMICQVLNTNISKPISLNFKRKLSYLNVVYNKNAEGIIPMIAVYGLYPKCKINLQTGILKEGANSTYGIVTGMYRYEETINEYSYGIIIPPFNFKNYVSIQVDLNGELSYYTIPYPLPFGEGTWNTIYLTEIKRNITCSVATDEGVGGTVSGDGVYINGRQCTVSATECESYLFDGWFKNGTLISKNLDYTFTVSEDLNLEARFSKCRIVTIEDNWHGTYKDYIKGAGKYRKGETCYLKADNKGKFDNLTFVGWFVDGKLMSRHWWYAFQPNKNINIEARYDIVWYGGWWETEEVTFPAAPGAYYWEHKCNTVTTYSLDAEPAIHSIEAFFVEDSDDFYSPHGIWEDFTIEIKSLDLSRTLAATNGSKGEVRYQNLTEPGFHVVRKIKYKYISQRNHPVKGTMYYRSISYHAHQLDIAPYYP